jgi:membrane-bound ClpP family serine protease
MIRAVANFFAGVIGIFIVLAIIAIVIGIKIALDANTDQEVLLIGASMVIGGVVALFSMGMACVLLDIMFNTRKISENTKSKWYTDSNNVHRAEPEL